MIERYAGLSFLITTLRADATLMALLPGGVHDTPGRDRVLPFATVTVAAERTTQNVDGTVLFAHEYYLVQVYDRGTSWVKIVQALNRINDLLGYTAGGTVSGGNIYSTRRDDGGPLPRVDIEPDGQQYRQDGMYYHLQIQAA